jgi:hypothetical protein
VYQQAIKTTKLQIPVEPGLSVARRARRIKAVKVKKLAERQR